LIFLSTAPPGIVGGTMGETGCFAVMTRKNEMAKGNNSKGNKEAKKPKKEKPKVLATANSGLGKAPIKVAGKKVK